MCCAAHVATSCYEQAVRSASLQGWPIGQVCGSMDVEHVSCWQQEHLTVLPVPQSPACCAAASAAAAGVIP